MVAGPRNQPTHTGKATFSRRGKKGHNRLLRRPFSFCCFQRRPKCHLYCPAVGCLPVSIPLWRPIDVHGGCNVGMPHQILLHPHLLKAIARANDWKNLFIENVVHV
jgi:hypothetical protein